MNSMNSSNPMSSSTGSMSMMTPWLHFGTTDYLLFKTWQPKSNTALTAACIGVIVFCVLERSLSAYRRVQEFRWKTKLVLTSGGAHSVAGKGYTSEGSREGLVSANVHRLLVPPFAFSRDIPRGLIQAVQSTFSYALMLIIMSFNGAYIISVILGLGIGEVFFGRIGRVQEEI